MKDRSSIRAALAVLQPASALGLIGWGVGSFVPWALVIGSLLLIDFWSARVGGFIRRLKFGPPIPEQEDAE